MRSGKKLETLYEGDPNVKIAKWQSLKGKYEMLRMGDDENITTFMQRVNELVCGIRCAGGWLEELEIVAKVLRSFPVAYKFKDTTTEELHTLTNVTRDMLIGKLTTFELSEFGDALPKIESVFKVTTSGKDK